MTLQELVVDLRLNAEDFARGLESAMTTWESFGSSLLKIGAGLSAALTVPIVGIGQAAIKMGTQLQQAEIAFGTMLGSAELAGNYLNELKDFAAKTPFEFSELVPAAKRLMALGFAAEETIPMLKALGNAAAGLGGGAALIQRLGLALGQMRAKAKVSAEEMRQLAEAGIPAWEMLAKAMGKTTGELMKLSEKGQVSAAAAIPILIAGINEKFGGLMEGFMQTAMGQYSNVKDQLGFVLADIGKALLPIAALLIEKFALPAVSALRDLAAWFSKLNESTKMTIIAFAALAASLGPVALALGGFGYMYAPIIAGSVRVSVALVGMASNIAYAIQNDMVGALMKAELQLLKFVGIAGPALAIVGGAFLLWQIEPVRTALTELWNTTSNYLKTTLEPFVAKVIELGKMFSATASEFMTSARSMWDAVGPVVIGVGQLVLALTALKLIVVGVTAVYWGLIPAVNAAAASFASMAITNTVAALRNFAMVTIPVVITALSAMTETMLAGAAASFMQFATVSVPAAYAALMKFATVAVPASVASLRALSFTSITASVTALAGTITTTVTAAFIGLGATITSFASTAIPSVLSGLGTLATAVGPILVTAVLSAAAAFAGWKLGQWAYDNIPGVQALGDALAELLMRIPGIVPLMGLLDGTNKKTAVATRDLEFATKKLEESLKLNGITVARGKMTLEEYAAALRKAAIDAKLFTENQSAMSGAANARETAILVKALEAAKKAYEDVRKSGTASVDELAASTIALHAAQSKLDERAKATGKDQASLVTIMKEVRKEQTESIKNLEALRVKQAELSKQRKLTKAEEDEMAAAEARVNAARTTSIATTTRVQALAKQLGYDYAALIKSTNDVGAATATLEDQEKRYHEQLKVAERQYNAVARAVQAGTASKLDLAKASVVLSIAENKANPEKMIDWQQKQIDNYTKWSAKLSEVTAKGEKMRQGWLRLQEDISDFGEVSGFSKVDQELMRISATSEMLGKNLSKLKIPESLMDMASEFGTAFNRMHDQTKGLVEDQKLLGIAGMKTADDLEAAYNRIASATTTEGKPLFNSREMLAADKRYLEARQAEYEAGGRELTELERKRLDSYQRDNRAATITTTEELKLRVDAERKALAEVEASTKASHADRLQRRKALLEAELDLAQAGGEGNVKILKREIEEIDKQLAKLAGVYKGFWQQIGDSIKSIAMGWAADVGRGLWKTALGKSRREFNKGLDQQAVDLNASLQERTQEWEDYQSEIASRQEAAQKEYEDTLAEESAALQASLDERMQDYTDAEAETAQKLDEVRAEYAKDLADQLSDLAVSLDERRVEYEDYVQEIAGKLAETRQTHAEQLAEQLSDLQDSLDDHRRSYDEYVADVNKKLSRVGEDYAESIDDETKQVKAGVDDKKKQYKRDEDDILEKIARLKKASKTEQDEEIQDLRKSLRRKAEDLEEYIRESGEKLDEFVSDAKRRNDRELADLKESLDERTEEWTRYQEDNQNKRNEYINKNAQDLAKEEADLAKSLSDRTSDWVKYQSDNAKKVDEAYTKYTEGLAKEEADLVKSLDKKKRSLDDYIVEVNKKWAKIQEAAMAKLNQEESDLAASLTKRGAEYDKYVNDIQTRLDEIKEMHRSAWDEIGKMMVGAFERAGESVMTFITTYLMDKLLNALTKGSLWDAVVNFGKKIADVFTGGGGTGEAPQIPGIPKGTTQGQNEGSGEGDVTGKGGSPGGGGSMSPASWLDLGMKAFDFGFNLVTNRKFGSTQENTYKIWKVTEMLLGFLAGPARQDWIAAATNSFISASTLSAMRHDFQTGAYSVGFGGSDYTKVLEEIRGILDNVRSILSQIREGAGQLTSSIVDAVTSPFTPTTAPLPPLTSTTDELEEAKRKLEETRIGVGIASASSAFADELEKLFTGGVGEEGTAAYLKRIANLAFQLKESGVLSAKQYEALSTAITAMIEAGNIGPGADAVRTLVEQLRETGSMFDDWARKVEENSAAVDRLTAQLTVTSPVTSPTTTGPATAPGSLIGSFIDAASTAAKIMAVVTKPSVPMEGLAQLLRAQEATLDNVQKGIDPNNPTGIKSWAEAYAANTGSAYQSWLSGAIASTKDMLAQWSKYNAALQAIANLGQMAGDLSRFIPGMVNPLSMGAPSGVGAPVNVMVSELTVNTVIDGRVVGNAVISNLALQGVRI